MAAADVRSQDPLPCGEMLVRVDHPAIAREPEESGRWRAAVERRSPLGLNQWRLEGSPSRMQVHSRAVLVPGNAPARRKRHGGIIPEDPGSCQHMTFDRCVDRDECHTGMADQIGKSGQTDIHAFAHKPPGLTVQRRVLTARHCSRTNGARWPALGGRHRDRMRPGPATGNRMERRRSSGRSSTGRASDPPHLADLPASPAGELPAPDSDLRGAGSPSTGAG